MSIKINFESFKDELEKIALVGVDDIAGAFVGHHMGKKQKERGEGYSFGGKQIAGGILIPGGVGYQAGRYMAHHSSNSESKKKK